MRQRMVGDVGFEPTTSRTRIVRATICANPRYDLSLCVLYTVSIEKWEALVDAFREDVFNTRTRIIMCYSATASFVASGVLTTIGIATLVTAKKEDRVVASIPLLFGIQQGIEGIQWLSMAGGATNCLAGYSYSGFAFLLWPILIPIAVWSIERHRTTLYAWLFATGLAVALFTLFFLIVNPLQITMIGQSISYEFGLRYGPLVVVGYLIATLGSLLLSDNKLVRLWGIFATLAALLAGLISKITFASVWCFYCAILSAGIFIFIYQRRHAPPAPATIVKKKQKTTIS